MFAPLAVLPDFFQNMAYKIGDNLSTLSISHFGLLIYTEMLKNKGTFLKHKSQLNQLYVNLKNIVHVMIVTVLTIWWVAPEKFTNKVERVKESVSGNKREIEKS